MTRSGSATHDRPDDATWRAWGIDPAWSRVVEVPSHDGGTRRWHLLATGDAAHGGATILCVHGNPTWGYAWRSFLERLGDENRVIAIDQLGMGYSDRLDAASPPRRYAARVADLDDLVRRLDVDPASPLVLAAHDWGGAIALGWAVDHPDRVAGMVLCNTGIAVPAGRRAPAIIRLAASAPLRDLVCRRTPVFVEGTVRLSGRRLGRQDRVAFRAPYRSAGRRRAIADFVGDVPLTDDHESAGAIADVAGRLGGIEAPVLLAWGARDIVFDDDFAVDLLGRLPGSRLQRFPDAGHLVMAEADVASTVATWLADLRHTAPESMEAARPAPAPTPAATSVFDGINRRRTDSSVAVADLAGRHRIDFATFAARVDGVAAALVRRGLAPGDRVAMLTPPGIDLLIAVYGVWRAGGVTVIADRGLGLGGLGRAVASARPAWTIGPRRAQVASTILRWAPRASHLDPSVLAGEERGSTALPPEPDADAPAAILFTSGATGPAKGVRYRHGQLAAQRDALATTYDITDADRLVAAFAPFALYGPALGVPTALTDCDVTRPGSLTADALDEACREIGATMAFASPAALSNVVETAAAAGSLDGVAALRLVFSAGAPVPAETLHAFATCAPRASIRTPYGMTEALPVADIDLAGIDRAHTDGDGRGVCVGVPVAGAEVRIACLDFDPMAGVPDPVPPGETGEILVRAPWVSQGYLGRWETERRARPGGGWHRSGDVGHLDPAGRLWVEGRSVHVIDTSQGIVTPVPVERAVERALAPSGSVRTGRVAAVGVGPAGCQQVVVVIEQADRRDDVAGRELAAAVRAVVDVSVAAVLVTDQLPVDIRHNAKIDRSAVAEWATTLLS